VLPSRLILFNITFSLAPGPLSLLASVALRSDPLFLMGFLHVGQRELGGKRWAWLLELVGQSWEGETYLPHSPYIKNPSLYI
jgi:hypothetical protein